MATQTEDDLYAGMTPLLVERLKAHREHVARLRDEIPDVEAELAAIVREYFDPAAFEGELEADRRRNVFPDDQD